MVPRRSGIWESVLTLIDHEVWLMPTAAQTRHRLDGHLRLSACPRCAHRRRAIVEVSGRLVGRCLACGEGLDRPLDTVREAPFSIVGRGGQRILGAQSL